MGRLYIEYLEGRVYSCKFCACHLATSDEIVSKSFHSRNGKAYLFNSVVNTASGPKEERMMTTGRHEVSDLHCTSCMQLVGWKYESAQDKSQKYKEGKYILERSKMVNADEGLMCSAIGHLMDSDCEDGITA